MATRFLVDYNTIVKSPLRISQLESVILYQRVLNQKKIFYYNHSNTDEICQSAKIHIATTGTPRLRSDKYKIAKDEF